MRKDNEAIIHLWANRFWETHVTICGIAIWPVSPGPPFITTLIHKNLINCKRCLKIMRRK